MYFSINSLWRAHVFISHDIYSRKCLHILYVTTRVYCVKNVMRSTNEILEVVDYIYQDIQYSRYYTPEYVHWKKWY